ncbi:hypothetical protein, partial [Vibrio parahaemolyticus]|uniref:hypothetical protein n=2 Tax=Vibrio parahaemolyticus TaxID=670 RepID=UPI001C4EB0D3
ALHLVKCAFHVLSGGTICNVLALTSPFTVSNFRAISLVWLLWCWEILVNTEFLWRCRLVLQPVSFANLKAVK